MGNHVKFARFVLLADLYIFTRLEITSSTYCRDYFFSVHCIIKQLLDAVFVISVRVTSFSLRLRPITPTLTLIILDIIKKTLIRQLSMIGSLGNVLNDKNF